MHYNFAADFLSFIVEIVQKTANLGSLFDPHFEEVVVVVVVEFIQVCGHKTK